MQDLEHLKAHLQGNVVILGIGSSLRNDDAAGSLLVSRIKDKMPFKAYDAGPAPENYLGKIIKDKPETVGMIDAVDFGGLPGEFRVLEGDQFQTVNLFSTHNASLSLAINYLKNNLSADIIILAIQPKDISFGDTISPEVNKTIENLEGWFYELGEKKR